MKLFRFVPTGLMLLAVLLMLSSLNGCSQSTVGASGSLPAPATATPQTQLVTMTPSGIPATPEAAAATAIADDLAPLSGEFDAASTLSQWKQHSQVEGWPSQVETLDINTTSKGQLYLVPLTSTWFEDYRGIFLFKEVTGDFVVTTRIQATGKDGLVPQRTYSFGGLMARAPRQVTPNTWVPHKENWVFITTGYGDGTPGHPQIETKTTVNSKSDLKLIPSVTGWVDLSIIRIGPTFEMMYRFKDGAWTVSRHFDRPDLPGTLQVGLNAYTNWESIHGDQGAFNRTVVRQPELPPDLIVRSDYIRFRRPVVPAAQQQKLANGSMGAADWAAIAGN